MDSILKDDRFARIATDAKFRAAGNKKKKVAIDKRFESMFQVSKKVLVYFRISFLPSLRVVVSKTKENYELIFL